MILQGKTVSLMMGSPKSVVVDGIVFVNSNKLHNAPMSKDCIRVSIDEILKESAQLPFPIYYEVNTVGCALGTHVV